MPRLPQVSGHALIQLLRSLGYEILRQRGSHVRLRKVTVIVEAFSANKLLLALPVLQAERGVLIHARRAATAAVRSRVLAAIILFGLLRLVSHGGPRR